MTTLHPRFRLPVGTYCYYETPRDGFVRVRVSAHVPPPEAAPAGDGMTFYRVTCSARVRGAWPHGREAIAALSDLVPPNALRCLRSKPIRRAHDWRDRFQNHGSYGKFRGIPLCLDETGRVCVSSRPPGAKVSAKYVLFRGIGLHPTAGRYLYVWRGHEQAPLHCSRFPSIHLAMTDAEAAYYCVPDVHASNT